MTDLIPIGEVIKATGRSKHSVHRHVKLLGVGRKIAGLTFLTKTEAKRVVKAIDSKRGQYDAANKTKEARRAERAGNRK